MEKQSPRRMKSSHLCIPRLKVNATCTVKSPGRLSPMSLLERFREAVFRLMMLSALSKTSHSAGGSSSPGRVRRSYQYPTDDPHHNEAVADCIEFIKKTTLSDVNNNCGSTSERVIPVPVINRR